MGNLVKDVWQWLKNNAAPVAVVITIIPATMGGGCAVGEDHPDVAIDRNNLGSVWETKGEYDKAAQDQVPFFSSFPGWSESDQNSRIFYEFL